MDDLETIVRHAQQGDVDAFATLVLRFQDMAVGYAFAVLRDAYLAEDAAQEAFLDAFRSIGQVREPAAFPGWFRRVVFKHCDRARRRAGSGAAPCDTAVEPHSDDPQFEIVERQASTETVRRAIALLPEHERTAVTLFYFGGHSHVELGAFLGVPISTVKKRLHSGRKRIKHILMDEFERALDASRPSRDEAFARSLIDMLAAARAGDAARVADLLHADPRLSSARDWLGNSAIVLAANAGRTAVVDLLAEAGVVPDYFESAAIGATERVRDLLRLDSLLLNAFSAEGFPAIGLAAHFGRVETLRFLAASGADVDAVVRHPLEVAPIHAALFGRRPDAAIALLECGADPNARRGGAGMPRAGWSPLHYAAGFGFESLVDPLLLRKARINARDDEGRTPLGVAIVENRPAMAGLLRSRGATE